jgi:hypothetical protein
VQENALSGRFLNIIDHVEGEADICASYVQSETVQVRKVQPGGTSVLQEKFLGGREREGGMLCQSGGLSGRVEGPCPSNSQGPSCPQTILATRLR